METLQYTKSVPVLGHYDVIVCGGGAAGIGAALAAAEKGAKTALIERFGFLGGMATAGYVNPMSEFANNGRQVVCGMAWRFAQKLLENGGTLCLHSGKIPVQQADTAALVAQVRQAGSFV